MPRLTVGRPGRIGEAAAPDHRPDGPVDEEPAFLFPTPTACMTADRDGSAGVGWDMTPTRALGAWFADRVFVVREAPAPTGPARTGMSK